jgi:hypothetical protein
MNQILTLEAGFLREEDSAGLHLAGISSEFDSYGKKADEGARNLYRLSLIYCILRLPNRIWRDVVVVFASRCEVCASPKLPWDACSVSPLFANQQPKSMSKPIPMVKISP